MYLIGQSYPMNSPNFNSNVTLLIVIFIKLWLLHNLTLKFARNIIQRDQKPPNWVRAMNLIYFRRGTFRIRIRDRIPSFKLFLLLRPLGTRSLPLLAGPSPTLLFASREVVGAKRGDLVPMLPTVESFFREAFLSFLVRGRR